MNKEIFKSIKVDEELHKYLSIQKLKGKHANINETIKALLKMRQ